MNDGFAGSPVLEALRYNHRTSVKAPDRENAQSGISVTPSLLAVSVRRNGSSLGTLFLEGANGTQFGEKDIHTAETAAAMVIMLLEKRSSLELLTTVQQPINFYQPIDQFLNDLLYLVWKASGMKYVALRELQPDGKTLRCLNALGFAETDPFQFDLHSLESFSTFYRAITESKIQAEPRVADVPHLATIRARLELDSINSFVVAPIKVGNSIFGTLSFAAECEYNYSALELAGFETIANSIGVAVSNYRNAERVHEIFVETARVAISFTALEVAQSARHEARGSIDNAQHLLAALLTKVHSPKDDREGITQLITKIAQSLSAIEKAINKIRDASRMPEMKLKLAHLRQLWQEAIATVAGKMTSENVRHEIIGNAEISVYPEALRLAFLNLLLNSLDAFHEFGKKSGRKITITIDPRTDEAQHVRIRYHDNASGIIPDRLKVPPDINKGLPPKDLIFELGVTSKEQGSGYGLYLVRRILDNHKGSINLVDYRGGVTFDITLPKNQTVAAEAAKN